MGALLLSRGVRGMLRTRSCACGPVSPGGRVDRSWVGSVVVESKEAVPAAQFHQAVGERCESTGWWGWRSTDAVPSAQREGGPDFWFGRWLGTWVAVAATLGKVVLGLLLSVGTLGMGTMVGVRCGGPALGTWGLLLSVGWSLRRVASLVGVSVCREGGLGTWGWPGALGFSCVPEGVPLPVGRVGGCH